MSPDSPVLSIVRLPEPQSHFLLGSGPRSQIDRILDAIKDVPQEKELTCGCGASLRFLKYGNHRLIQAFRYFSKRVSGFLPKTTIGCQTPYTLKL